MDGTTDTALYSRSFLLLWLSFSAAHATKSNLHFVDLSHFYMALYVQSRYPRFHCSWLVIVSLNEPLFPPAQYSGGKSGHGIIGCPFWMPVIAPAAISIPNLYTCIMYYLCTKCRGDYVDMWKDGGAGRAEQSFIANSVRPSDSDYSATYRPTDELRGITYQASPEIGWSTLYYGTLWCSRFTIRFDIPSKFFSWFSGYWIGTRPENVFLFLFKYKQ